MPIKGLTDNVIPRFPRLGKLRKGGEQQNGKYGKDLEYFRFTSENPAIVKAFTDAYGEQPAMLHVYLPYPSIEMNFSTWKEKWSAGGLMHRCDGETMTIWRTPAGTYSSEPKPCPYHNRTSSDKKDPPCDEVGRLEMILPELITAGFVGYVTLETHSLHDLMNITATLAAVFQQRQEHPHGLQGIEFVLRRKLEKISTPGDDGKRVRRDKWLVSLEPVPSWAQTYLAMASGSTLAIEAPQNVDLETGEVLDDDDVVEGSVVTDDAQPTNGTQAQADAESDAEFETMPSASAEGDGNEVWRTWRSRSDAIEWVKTLRDPQGKSVLNGYEPAILTSWTHLQQEKRISGNAAMYEPFYYKMLGKAAGLDTNGDSQPTQAQLDELAASQS